MSAPSVGRIVHLHRKQMSDQPIAGIINYVHAESRVDVTAFLNQGSGSGLITHVPYSREPQEGHWSWPPRV